MSTLKSILFLLTIFLVSCGTKEKGSKVTLQVDEPHQRVTVKMDGKPFTTYRFDSALEKPVLYPVYAPGGYIITRGFPLDQRDNDRLDHPHHVGFWFNYGEVNGYDFWGNSYAIPEEKMGKEGRIVYREIVRAEEKGDQAVLEVKTDWMAPDNDHAKKLLEEHTTFKFQGDSSMYIVDRTTRLTAVVDTVVFTDTKEGMLAIRVDRAFEHPTDKPVVYTDDSGDSTKVVVLTNEGVTGWYRNSEGIEGIDVWGKRARWIKLRGTKEGITSSIILMDHPENTGHPTYWHARGYGLFSVNNIGRKAFNHDLEPNKLILKKGESVTFRHRLLVATGDLTDEEIEANYRLLTTKDYH